MILASADFLVARALPGLLPESESRGVIRVLIASLAHGGAERIVLDWLAEESRLGRASELAVLHRRATAWAVPEGVILRVRGREAPNAFLRALARDWAHACEPVSVHLVPDAQMAILWEAGITTVPVVHNSREGWRNDPASWHVANVPMAIACAEAVRQEMIAAGCTVPVVTIRHRPSLSQSAWDPVQRAAVRASLGVGPATLLVGAVGAIKRQKDYVRAVQALGHLATRRDAALAIVGGVLEGEGLGELDRIAEGAARLRLGSRLKLPGFADPVEPYYAAFDVFLNVSRHEGLSIATQEALAAGLPVVACAVGGQPEMAAEGLTLIERDASAVVISEALADFPVRTRLDPRPWVRAPRIWSLPLGWRERAPSSSPRSPIETLFVTANLNAGGAQRSLVNLCVEIRERHALAVAVCGDTSHPAFPGALIAAGVEATRPAGAPDPFALAEEVLAMAMARSARQICFWNLDPKVKLLVAKFAPPGLRLLDVSPGRYAFEELHSQVEFSGAIACRVPDYYRRLDALVLKHRDPDPPTARHIEVIANGVPARCGLRRWPTTPRFLVSGRIAPSKRLETILEALAIHLRAFPGAGLEIVGQAEERHAGYLARVLAQAATLPVRFRGAMPGLEFLDEHFTAAVVLGTHQGCPNAVLEAMAAGLPVIANASGGTVELVVNGESGWLLEVECDALGLSDAMAQAASDPARLRRMGAAGSRRAGARHGLGTMASRYLALLECAPTATSY